MDYPKSVLDVGLVDGKFVDEDITTGTIGSLVPSAWSNALTDEVLSVIAAAGLDPEEEDLTQLLQSIRKLATQQADLSIQKNYAAIAVASGTADALTGNFTPAISALTNGMVVYVRASSANATAAPTFNADEVSAKSIVKGAGVALFPGDIAGAGHWLELQYDAALDKWVLQNPANGVANIQHGQCRLTKVDTNLVLSPCNGNKLLINGQAQIVPTAGVTLAPTGLTANTLYYIYAFMSGSVMALEASTTGHSADVITGVEIKTGDPTRTLVGMAYPIAGPAWADSDSQRHVTSYFNSIRRRILNQFSANRSTSSSVMAEIHSEIRCGFVTFATEATSIAFLGEFYTSLTAGNATAAPAIDGVYEVQVQTPATTSAVPFCCRSDQILSEGFHVATAYGRSTAGSTTFGAVTSLPCFLTGIIV